MLWLLLFIKAKKQCLRSNWAFVNIDIGKKNVISKKLESLYNKNGIMSALLWLHKIMAVLKSNRLWNCTMMDNLLNKVNATKKSCVIVALQGCVIVALQSYVIVALQGCVIVALQGCMIVVLQGCVIVASQGWVTVARLQGCMIVALQGWVIVVLQGCVIVVLQGCVIVLLRARLRDCLQGCVIAQC
jgi:hypothetical protein